VPFAASTAVTSPDISAARATPTKIDRTKTIRKSDVARFICPPPFIMIFDATPKDIKLSYQKK
jgi:hypothetical protein